MSREFVYVRAEGEGGPPVILDRNPSYSSKGVGRSYEVGTLRL